MANEYTLIVNGKQKPWPTVNYMDSPISIDLNWGLDTNSYQADVVSFTLKELIAGKKVKYVKYDANTKQVICTIPIVEKSKSYRFVFDWTPIKEQIRNGISVEINGKSKKLTDGTLLLSGKDLSVKYNIFYNGEKCEISEEEGNIIRVSLPGFKVKIPSLRERTFKNWLMFFLPGMLLSLVLGIITIGLYSMCNDNQDNAIVTVNEPEDDIPIESEKEKENVELSNARDYLITHSGRWNRDEMASISPKLTELFDAVNEFKFDETITIIDEFNVQDDPTISKLYNTLFDFKYNHNFKGYYTHDGIISLEFYIRRLLRNNDTNQEPSRNIPEKK